MASLELGENGELALPRREAAHTSVGGPHSSTGKKGSKKKRDTNTLRKAPQAPKRFKSSYICFFMAKQPEIKDILGAKATVTEISKRSAQMWRSLPPEERAHWDDVAAKDKQRYMVEKASYTGPWQVPWKRARKDPSAPKRPMSAFLYFSQGRRRQIKDANPSMKNTEVSRLLGEMWRNAPEEERKPHVEKEREEREKYKVAIADWRKDFEARQEKDRKAQAEQAAYMAGMCAAPTGDPHHVYGDPSFPAHYPGHHSQTVQPAQSGQALSSFGVAPTYPYGSYPMNPYQYPTNGKQPVILGPNGTPRYPPPGPPPLPPPPPNSYNAGAALQSPEHQPSHTYGASPPPPAQPLLPPQAGYGFSQNPHSHHGHYDCLPEQHGMDLHQRHHQAQTPRLHHNNPEHLHQNPHHYHYHHQE